MIDEIVSVKMILILLAVGTIIWATRKILPVSVEKNKVWKAMLYLIPIAIGIGLSFVPGLRPMEEISQSVVIGGVAGSLSSTVYDFAREALGERVKSFLGGKK